MTPPWATPTVIDLIAAEIEPVTSNPTEAEQLDPNADLEPWRRVVRGQPAGDAAE